MRLFLSSTGNLCWFGKHVGDAIAKSCSTEEHFQFFFYELSELALLCPRLKNSCILFEDKKYCICSIYIETGMKNFMFTKANVKFTSP